MYGYAVAGKAFDDRASRTTSKRPTSGSKANDPPVRFLEWLLLFIGFMEVRRKLVEVGT